MSRGKGSLSLGPNTAFTSTAPSLETYWRGIILFGRNVASYKFALGKALMELADQGKTFVTLEELADPFSRHLCQHLEKVDRQATSPASGFLESCRSFNRGEISKEQMNAVTARVGFVNVIDAFPKLNRERVPAEFYADERRTRGGITLGDDLFALRGAFQYQNLPQEVEARWRLVETAWELGLPRHMLAVQYEEDGDLVVVALPGARRREVTHGRHALNSYQKGRCFYCGTEIALETSAANIAHVDHFVPRVLQRLDTVQVNLNGVWNLVLACRDCNLSKSSRVPSVRLLERLHRRNEHLIGSVACLRIALPGVPVTCLKAIVPLPQSAAIQRNM